MRYLHLFLIFNLIVCYAGICGETVFAVVGSPAAEESCHASSHEMAETDEYSINIKANADEELGQSPCCLDYLNGSSTDNTNNVFTVVDIIPVSNLYSKKIEGNRLEPELVYKDHDPPDLQISFSTFIL